MFFRVTNLRSLAGGGVKFLLYLLTFILNLKTNLLRKWQQISRKFMFIKTGAISGGNQGQGVSNASPSIIFDSISTFTEGSVISVGAVAATFTVVDVDPLDTHTVSFTNGADTHYTLSGNSILLKQAAIDDIGLGTPLPVINLTATDNGVPPFSARGIATPSITLTNDTPTLSFGTVNSFTEDSGVAVGAVVTSFTTSDEDGDNLTVTFTGGTNLHYTINGLNVELTQAGVEAVNSGGPLNPVDLTITDDGTPNLSSNSVVSPSVILTNDTPTLSFSVVNDFTEDSGALVGDTVATFTTGDEDGDNLTVTFTGGTNTHYSINGFDVELTQAGVDAINAGTSLNAIDLTVTDDGTPNLSSNTVGNPSVTTINDTPTLTFGTPTTFVEDSGVVVGAVAVSFTLSDEENDNLVVSFIGSSPQYSISGNTIVLTQAGVDDVNLGLTLNPINLRVTDDGVPPQFSDAITAPTTTQTNDTPTVSINSVSAFTEYSNPSVGDVAATFTTSDEEAGTLTVTFTGSNPEYSITGNTVTLTQLGVDNIVDGIPLSTIDLTVTDTGTPTQSSNTVGTPTLTGVFWSPLTKDLNSGGTDKNIIDLATDGSGTWIAGLQSGYMARSTDDGLTWVSMPRYLGSVDHTETMSSIATDSNGTWVVAFEFNWVARSTDNGVNWTHEFVNFTGSQYDIITVATDSAGTWVLGTGFALMSKSTDNALTWSNISISSGLSGQHSLTSIKHSSGTWVVSSSGGVIFRSTDNWATNSQSSIIAGVSSPNLATDGSGIWLLDAGGGNILRSTDDGVTFTTYAGGVLGGGNASTYAGPKLESNNGDKFILIQPSGLAYCSENDGVSFTGITTGLNSGTLGEILCIKYSPTGTWITGHEDGYAARGRTLT